MNYIINITHHLNIINCSKIKNREQNDICNIFLFLYNLQITKQGEIIC